MPPPDRDKGLTCPSPTRMPLSTCLTNEYRQCISTHPNQSLSQPLSTLNPSQH
ncbi:hypothetical protein L873DRAFT_1797942 [Choiromyces venosus 120613-1]|uniref:Uncharacterized protein n=1 Tax=Choiromyces venosus 120613-1 TaxID=1336337 RepID=A0A3N4K4N9_9PEZI|nr:hypothetical protein L873DRAFT_1797942 [Choiromyces venosus 120613-1]